MELVFKKRHEKCIKLTFLRFTLHLQHFADAVIQSDWQKCLIVCIKKHILMVVHRGEGLRIRSSENPVRVYILYSIWSAIWRCAVVVNEFCKCNIPDLRNSAKYGDMCGCVRELVTTYSENQMKKCWKIESSRARLCVCVFCMHERAMPTFSLLSVGVLPFYCRSSKLWVGLHTYLNLQIYKPSGLYGMEWELQFLIYF